ncbi:hypothetical protein [Arsenophonus nasoniae]|uniref:hypothetical protein n=1 Tax=Arsenophonus nasoniae TaxID=638 RepID=UPI0038797827
MFKQLSRKGRSLYVGAVLRDQLDKIVVDIGHYVGRPILVTEFVQYVIERHAEEAKEKLKVILGTEEERTTSSKKR